MRKTKKILALALSAAMTMGMVGCGGNSDTQGDASTTPEAGGSEVQVEVPAETITLNVYSQLANYSGEMQGWFAKLMLDKFNVKINIIQDGDGVYDSLMQEGDLGDIAVWGSDGSQFKQAVKAGLLLDWEMGDLAKTYAPYVWENMQTALEKNRAVNAEAEGDAAKIHGFGHNVATSSNDIESFLYTWDIRWDLYNQLGCPEIKTLDDYYNLMVSMKEICPKDENGNETYAISVWPDWDGNMVMYVKSMVTAFYGYDEFGIGNYNVRTGEFYDCLAENGPYLEMLKFFNKLYQNNLLDPNSMTQTYDKMIEKLKAGGTFFSIFNYAGSDAFNTDEHVAANQMMLPLVPGNATPIAYGMNAYGGNRVWSIGAKTQYPDICLAIINYLSTPEGRLTTDYGPKGLCWDYDANGKTYFTDFGKQCNSDRKNTMMPEEWGGGSFDNGSVQINNTTWSTAATNPESGEKYDCKEWGSMQLEPKCDTEKAWREKYSSYSMSDYMMKQNYVVAVGTTYSEGKRSDELTVTWNQVTNCVVKNSWNAIYAKDDAEFDSIVAKMRHEADEYGYAQCVEWSKAEAEIRNSLEAPLRK